MAHEVAAKMIPFHRKMVEKKPINKMNVMLSRIAFVLGVKRS